MRNCGCNRCGCNSCVCPPGPPGSQGPPGPPGPPGPTGPTGTFSTIQGTFGNITSTGPFIPSGTGFSGTVIPVTFASPAPINTPGAFTLNADGSVTVNVAGLYEISGSVLLEAGYTGSFGIQINGGGIFTPYMNSFGTAGNTTGTTQINRTTVLNLAAGDVVSIGLCTSNISPLFLSLGINMGLGTNASTLSFVKVG